MRLHRDTGERHQLSPPLRMRAIFSAVAEVDVTPTARSMAMLRSDGWTVEKVEQRLPIPGKYVTRDMGGFADLVAWRADYGIVAVQVTADDGGHVMNRVAKINALKPAIEWYRSGGGLWVQGWGKRGARGETKRWTCRTMKAVEVDGALEWRTG